MTAEPSDDDLHLLYLDWCSTRVARRFLELSHDEVWLRSHSAETNPSDDPGSPAESSTEGVPGYLELVRRTAVILAREMELPSFADWKERYHASPDKFAEDLLGGAGGDVREPGDGL